MRGADNAPEVLLVHGLWYGRWSMVFVARRLKRAGYRPRYFAYSSMLTRSRDTITRLRQVLMDMPERRVVAHSLGGLLLLEAWSRMPAGASGRAVLLGTPLNGSLVARRIARVPVLRWILGRSKGLLTRGVDVAAFPDVDIAMIAGSRRLGLGRLTGPLGGGGDGTVRLAETRHACLSSHQVLPVGHTGLLWSNDVVRAVRRFLVPQAGTPPGTDEG